MEFCGINSFSEHTTIDFAALTKGGLFGIFGDTGSGKSTILDCINFALYGDVERSKGKTDIINYRSSSAEATFVFDMLSDGKRRRYTVVRSVKKDKSGTHRAMLYEDGKCIADKATSVEKEIVRILGVGKEDFRRCIALPQGEFAQFVKSAPSERLELIERLFNLSKYGDRLKEKLSQRQAETEGRFQNLSGQMTQYDGVTQEALADNLKILKASRERLIKLKDRQKALSDECARLTALSQRHQELCAARLRMSEIEKNAPKMEELRRDLKALPKCAEAARAESEAAKKRSDLEKISADIEKFNGETEEEKKKFSSFEKELSSTDFDGEILRLTKLSAAYDACAGKPEKLAVLENKLVGKRAEYRKIERELAELEEKRATAQKDAEKAEEELLKRGGDNFEQLLSVEIKGGFLKSEYADILGYLVSLRSGARVYEDGSRLYLYIIGELDKKIAEYKEKLGHLGNVRAAGVDELAQTLQNARKQRERLISDLNDRRQKHSEILAEIRLKQGELKRVNGDGDDLRARKDEVVEELKRVFGESVKDYSARAEQVRADLESIKKRRAFLSERLENCKTRLSELGGDMKRLAALKNSAEEELERLEKRLREAVAESGMGSLERCRELAEKFSDLPNAEKSLEDYDLSVLEISARIRGLEAVKGIDGFTEETLSEALNRRSAADAEAEELTRGIAVAQNLCQGLEAKLAEKSELNKAIAVCERERNLLFQLREITRGNKFMEFIAGEYLCDISSLASSTLLKLTDGRYFLTYRDNNFSVGDNFDCGNLRGVNTLSGGETFLVSLSLALALSQTICSRSLRSIEFFFLDEGFGTLDATLLDTVMNALEKLKSSAFTIGVISHVEELKQRIDYRITVYKATESRGSTISVNY